MKVRQDQEAQIESHNSATFKTHRQDSKRALQDILHFQISSPPLSQDQAICVISIIKNQLSQTESFG